MKLTRLFESYRDVELRFKSENRVDPAEIKEKINLFKELRDKNIINSPDSDINKWKHNYHEFVNFLDKKLQYKSNKQIKRERKDNSPVLFNNEKMKIIFPTSMESCSLYRSNTKWCVTQKRHYSMYQDRYDHVLLFLIDKDNTKYAIAANQYRDIYFYDEKDKKLTPVLEDELYYHYKINEKMMFGVVERAIEKNNERILNNILKNNDFGAFKYTLFYMPENIIKHIFDIKKTNTEFINFVIDQGDEYLTRIFEKFLINSRDCGAIKQYIEIYSKSNPKHDRYNIQHREIILFFIKKCKKENEKFIAIDK